MSAGKWVIETDPQQTGNDKTDFLGWIKVDEAGGAHVLTQFPHWIGQERCKELMQKMCDGLNKT